MQGQATIAASDAGNASIFAPTLIDSDVGSTWALGDSNGCEVTAAGVLSCWGENTNGQFPGVVGNQITTKTAIAGLTNPSSTLSNAVLKVAIGLNHICALTASSLYCWGDNQDGEVGAGSTGGVLGVRSIPLAAPSSSCTSRCGEVTNSCGESVECGDCQTGYTCSNAGACVKSSYTCKTVEQCCLQDGCE